MDTEGTDEKLERLFSEAKQHLSVEMCTRPDHNHTESPCLDGCADHIHECSKGCGGWPCEIRNVADGILQLLDKHKSLHEQLWTIDTGISLGLNAAEHLLKETQND